MSIKCTVYCILHDNSTRMCQKLTVLLYLIFYSVINIQLYLSVLYPICFKHSLQVIGLKSLICVSSFIEMYLLHMVKVSDTQEFF